MKGRELSPMTQNFINTLYAKIIFGTLFFILNSTLSMGATSGKVEQHELLVIGTGPVVDENVARARKMAISEALIKGVEEYLTRRLGSQGMINNFPRLTRDIIPKAIEEIENFHILAEERMDGHYKILVRLKINDKVMEEKLREIGLIIMEGPPIKVLFLVSQIDSREGKSDYWWKDPENDSGFTLTDLALHRVFQERGFHPINRLSSDPEGEYYPEMKVMDLSNEDAIKWGTLYDAKVVIHGRSEIVEGERVSVMLKALDIEKGGFMSQDEETEKIDEASGSEEQVMQSIERAINNIATRLSPVIMRAFEGAGVEINQVVITLQGLGDFKQLKAFTEFFKKNMRGVISVVQTRVRGHSISISVEFAGDRDRFLGMLLKHESLPFQSVVNDTEDGEIIISIK